MVRVAVLEEDKCKSKRCGRLCYKFCPKVRNKIEAIRFEGEIPQVVESLCVGCGICVKKCPFKALFIVNLPDELEKECSHRFGPNTFKLFRLPLPSSGIVLGLLGQNGIGKTTALKIFSGEIRPNLGDHRNPPDWPQIVQHFRGSTLQEYFQRLGARELKVVIKPQYVDKIPQVVFGKVADVLSRTDDRDKMKALIDQLQLQTYLDRTLDVLSGGELQRTAIAATICRDADIYLFDEPSSFLDVKQRIQAAKAIHSLKQEGKTVIIAEHDLAILDYLSDQICVFYGIPGVYGVVSHVHGVRVGINLYLEGYIPDENMRFRKNPIVFHIKPPSMGIAAGETLIKWGKLSKTYEGFNLSVKAGEAKQSEVIGILGPNGIGKTTFVKLLAGIEKPDKGESPSLYGLTVSYKPQYISTEYKGTVKELLNSVAKEDFSSSWYQTQILNPLNVCPLLDCNINDLSGGELQRTAIASCLSKKAQIYLLDEPSAYLGVEERLSMAGTIRRIVEEKNATAFVVEHDIVAQDFIADRLLIFTGEPGTQGVADELTNLRNGMNTFLKEMGITFRRDQTTKRPRVNKEDSKLDKYQKRISEYYYVSS